MDIPYEDIINALKIKEEKNYIKTKENNELRPLIELVNQLNKLIYVENIIILQIINEKKLKKELIPIRTLKNKLIKKIKEKIKEISKKHKLKLEKILENETINQNNLELALNIIYGDTETTNEIKKIEKYKELQENLQIMQTINEKIEKLKQYTEEQLSKIIEIIKSNKKPSIIHILKYIKYKKQQKINNIQITKIQKEIHKNNREFFLEDGFFSLKAYCLEELTNTSRLCDIIEQTNPEELTEQDCLRIKENIEKNYKEIKQYIRKKIKELIKQTTQSRITSKLRQNQINDILYSNTGNYITYIENNIETIRNEQPLFKRLILIIKLINIVENNLDVIPLTLDDESRLKYKITKKN